MTLEKFNTLTPRDAVTLFRRCCGSNRWAQEMSKRRPFQTLDEMLVVGEKLWNALSTNEWKEAFRKHHNVNDMKSLRKQFFSNLPGRETNIATTPEKILKALYEGMKLYEVKFGYGFIIDDRDKNAEEILAILNERASNIPSEEIKIAAQEEVKLTRIRLQKLLMSNTSF